MRTCDAVVISAPQGRSGKTVISLALCGLLRQAGLSVQPFKRGPDYIDPSWLTGAAGRSCRNLDLFLMGEEALAGSFRQACGGADVAVIEGAHGLYDGLDSTGWGSTAHVARLLNVPIILVVNSSRMTGSIAAMVSGYQGFQPGTNIAGVILNNVSGKRHEQKLRDAVERYCEIPVVGAIPRDPDLQVSERHLGLIPFPEAESPTPVVERICRKVGQRLDLDSILAIGRSSDRRSSAPSPRPQETANLVRIGVLRDPAFNFYYPENLEALSLAGAELVFFNSLRDRLPEVDGLYIGGGFPEFFLEELEANDGLRRDIAAAAEDDLPIYAECAGLMYLCQAISWKGRRYKMAGVIPAEVEMSQRPQGHGYVEAEVTQENAFLPVGLILRGHEFHHSRLLRTDGLRFAYRMRRGHGASGDGDAIIYRNVLASYTHLHALGTPLWAKNFVLAAVKQRKGCFQLQR